jgi:hypothetical protein
MLRQWLPHHSTALSIHSMFELLEDICDRILVGIA